MPLVYLCFNLARSTLGGGIQPSQGFQECTRNFFWIIMEHYSEQAFVRNETDIDGAEKWKSAAVGAPKSDDNSSCGFDCSICLDFVRDPVVTFCGHLYCWPCIYKWIQCQRVSPENHEDQPKCPVCKSELSEGSLIPLYGRGQSVKSSDRKSAQVGLVIPHRPAGPACGVITPVGTTTSSHPSRQLHHNSDQHPAQGYYPYFGDYNPSPALGLTGTSAFHPMSGMFGEMIYSRIFGNSLSSLYSYPNSYALAGSNSARVRRHVMQVDRSLSRVSFFLCCCIVACLLLF